MIIRSSNDGSKKRHLVGAATTVMASVLLASAFVIPAVTGSKKRADSEPVPITEENFPDKKFRQFMSLNLDVNKDGKLDDLERGVKESTDAKYANAYEMDLAGMEITDAKGIELFPNLKVLSLDSNLLDSLDVSKNTKLEELSVEFTNISEIDVSNNTALTLLSVGGTKLTSLDVSKNTNLDELNCYETDISELDLSNNTKLVTLRCGNTKIASLDVSKCKGLILLDAQCTQITELDLTANVVLSDLDVFCSKNLSKLNVKGLEHLTCVDCHDCAIEELDVSGNTSLTDFYCDNNGMKVLNIKGCSSLESAMFEKNELQYVDISASAILVDAYQNGEKHSFADNTTVYGSFALTHDQSKVDVLYAGFISDDATKIFTEAPATYTMPDVIGQYYKDASKFLEEDLKKAGYKEVHVAVGWAWTYSVPELCVADSTPKPGETWDIVTDEINVIIMVAEKYPTPSPVPTYTMPSVIGKNYEEAKSFLEEDMKAAGFKEVKFQIGWVRVDTAEPLTVVEQDPKADDVLDIADSITVTIMVAEKEPTPTPAGYTMPNVIGKNYEEAKSFLEEDMKAAGFKEVKFQIGWVRVDTAEPLTVVDQEPDADSILCIEDSVTVSLMVAEKRQDPPTPTPVKDPSIGDFVERLYTIALDRESEPAGKAFWIKEIEDGNRTGGDCAYFFLIEAPEFKNRGLGDEDFVETLYKTFFDRASEAEGKAFWVGQLKNKTMTRDRVILGFIDSKEWCNVCATYGVKSGAMTAKAEIASKNAINFATRLYTCCLGRDAEEKGLKYWSLALTNLEQTGCSAAKEFFTSQEFVNLKLKDDEYVKRLYTTFMGRDPEDAEVAYWAGEIAQGRQSRGSVLAFFGESPEFTDICKKYGIERGKI